MKELARNDVLDTHAFLAMLHGADAPIFFQVAERTWKNKPQTFRQAEKTLRWRNAEGEGIAFIVNSAGTKDCQITRFNAVFIDWDCGRGPDDRYWPLDHVARAKAGFAGMLVPFLPAPSVVVETRNGYHVYWLLNDNVTEAQFRDCQMRLAQFFGSDPKVCNPARAMRLPGFNWVKSGYDPFPVQVVSGRDVRYRLEDVVRNLPAVIGQSIESSDGHFEGTVDGIGKCAHNKCKSASTLALIVGAFPARETQDGTKVIVSSVAEALDYLKRQDLAHYLGAQPKAIRDQGTTVTCPFHADTSPSASVFRSAASGHWMFKCHSTRCGVSGTIIDVAMRKNGLPDEAAAFRHLLTHYQITIQTGWKEAQVAQLDDNIAVVRDGVALKAAYPSFYRLIGRSRADLISKLNWFRNHVKDERNRVCDEAIFFASLRQFHKLAAKKDELPKYFNRQNEKVDRYCLLGLLRKITDKHLPETILIEARRRQKESRHAHRIQIYSVPAYTDEVLKRADERARVLIEAGGSVRGVSLGERRLKSYPNSLEFIGSADRN